MPKYMLDTNMCIYLMKNQPPQVAARFALFAVGDVLISAVTYAELEYGVCMAANPLKERRRLVSLIDDIPVAPFSQGAAAAYGIIRRATRQDDGGYEVAIVRVADQRSMMRHRANCAIIPGCPKRLPPHSATMNLVATPSDSPSAAADQLPVRGRRVSVAPMMDWTENTLPKGSVRQCVHLVCSEIH